MMSRMESFDWRLKILFDLVISDDIRERGRVEGLSGRRREGRKGGAIWPLIGGGKDQWAGQEV